MQQEDLNKYKPVNIKFFQKLKESPCHLYIKLADQKFVKILKSQDQITTDFLLKYIKRKVTHLYLASLDYEKHSDLIFSFTPAMTKLVEAGRKVQLPSNDQLNAVLEEAGVPEHTANMAVTLSEKILNQVNSNESLMSMLNLSLSSEKRFLYDHSHLTSVVSCYIAGLPQNEWGTISAKEKLCMASIFHDLLLDEEEAIMVETHGMHEGIINDLIDDRNLHPKKMADKLREQRVVPLDVVSIIENHHNLEKPNLSPMICAFIVGHQFVLEMYKVEFQQERMPLAIDRTLGKFPNGNLNKQARNLFEALAKA